MESATVRLQKERLKNYIKDYTSEELKGKVFRITEDESEERK